MKFAGKKAAWSAIAGSVALILGAGAMPFGNATMAAPAPVTLTWWTWTANAKNVAAAFMKTHPDIRVKVVDPGAGSALYTKLETVIQAGSGGPDVTQIEYQMLPQFIASGGLANIAPYVRPYAKDYPRWVWDQVSRGNAVYAVPEDIGPMALFYRPREFAKYHLAIPTTWATFAQDAIKLHREDPHLYLSYFAANDGGWITGLLWQAGARLFAYTPKGWVVDIDSPQTRQVMNYWGQLIKSGAIPVVSDFSPTWGAQLSKGVYLSMIGAAWSPAYELSPYIKVGTQHWWARELPQWRPGQLVSANWGGSTNAVLRQSQHQAQAALFAAWINTSPQGLTLSLKPYQQGGRGLYPAALAATKAPDFNVKEPILDGQDANATVFQPSAAHVWTGFQWSPWSLYLYNQMTVQFTDAAEGKESWNAALANIQANVVQFARTEGFTVISQ